MVVCKAVRQANEPTIDGSSEARVVRNKVGRDSTILEILKNN
jgi:hypothetical protein